MIDLLQTTYDMIVKDIKQDMYEIGRGSVNLQKIHDSISD